MFDFFRDMFWELRGLDASAVKSAQEEKRERKKLDRFIFSRITKILVVILGFFYIAVAATMLALSRSSGRQSMVIFQRVITALVDIAVIASLLSGTKKGEIFALAGIFVFFVAYYLFIAFK